MQCFLICLDIPQRSSSISLPTEEGPVGQPALQCQTEGISEEVEGWVWYRAVYSCLKNRDRDDRAQVFLVESKHMVRDKWLH